MWTADVEATTCNGLGPAARQKREQEEPGKKQKCQRNETSQRNLAGKETKGIKKQNEQKNRIGAEPVSKRQYRKRGIT